MNGTPTADQIVEREVRELVRRRRLDPTVEAATVVELIDEVIRDYQERRLVANMPALTDPAATASTVHAQVVGAGPLQRYLDDPTVEEIWINEPGKVFIARAGRSELTTTVLTEHEVHDIVEMLLRSSGRRVDLSSPFVDATLPDGSRLHVVIPDITRRHWAVNIRKFVVSARTLDELVRLGSMPATCARFLDAAVVAGLNIVVAGGTQTGKTTLLNCLAAAIPPRERVITCEEVFELRFGLPDWIALQTRQPNLEGQGEIRQRRLIKEALRMRPDRIIVGEVRQEECLDLLLALNAGMPGMTSIHANSARDALVKLTSLPLLAGGNVTHGFVVPAVASSVALVVFLGRDAHGRRRVEEVLGVTGRVEEGRIEAGSIFRPTGGRLAWTGEFPPHPSRFEAIGCDLRQLLAGGQPVTTPVKPSESEPRWDVGPRSASTRQGSYLGFGALGPGSELGFGTTRRVRRAPRFEPGTGSGPHPGSDAAVEPAIILAARERARTGPPGRPGQSQKASPASPPRSDGHGEVGL
jgi:pilus assembly protein CpaF